MELESNYRARKEVPLRGGHSERSTNLAITMYGFTSFEGEIVFQVNSATGNKVAWVEDKVSQELEACGPKGSVPLDFMVEQFRDICGAGNIAEVLVLGKRNFLEQVREAGYRDPQDRRITNNLVATPWMKWWHGCPYTHVESISAYLKEHRTTSKKNSLGNLIRMVTNPSSAGPY